MSYCSFQTGEGMTLSTTQGNQLWTVPKARSSLVPLGWIGHGLLGFKIHNCSMLKKFFCLMIDAICYVSKLNCFLMRHPQVVKSLCCI